MQGEPVRGQGGGFSFSTIGWLNNIIAVSVGKADNVSKIECFKNICMKNSIALAYLFGSQAEAGLRLLRNHDVEPSDSLTDLDLAVYFDQAFPAPDQIPKLYAGLHNQMSDLFSLFSLDLVFLQEQHSVFQAQAIMGICIYAQNEIWRSEYEEDVLRRAADFKPFLDKFFEERLEESVQ